MTRGRAAGLLALGGAILVAWAPSASAKPQDAIRVGGPSAPGEPKVAIVGSKRNREGDPFQVLRGDEVVLRGRLTAAPGKPAPWRRAYAADLSGIDEPGSYRVRVGSMTSRSWVVADDGSRPALRRILEFFAANSDGREHSPIHAPSHLHDAVIHPDAPRRAGDHIDMTGGWMDAGDMVHFTQTTAFAAALLQAAARLDGPDRARLNESADVGVRWLVKAHPSPGIFIAQVGDSRDHNNGFRNPARDDSSNLPGIGTRFAYPAIGGDLGGKAAAALAMAYVRNGEAKLLASARAWYAAGKSAGSPAPRLDRAGYPAYAGDFYATDRWKESMAAGAAELYRATCGDGACEQGYLTDFDRFLRSGESEPGGGLGVYGEFAPFAAAEACGAFGGANPFPAAARALACGRLRENGRLAVRRARSNAFGMPGFFTWGTTATNGGSGALAALATATPGGLPGGCRTAAGARDYLLGRNPFASSFVVGYGPHAAAHPHHWASVFDSGLPHGAVVGGPAPRRQIKSQGFDVRGPLNTRFASYEDRIGDYVTSEPALDYSAASVLLLASLHASC